MPRPGGPVTGWCPRPLATTRRTTDSERLHPPPSPAPAPLSSVGVNPARTGRVFSSSCQAVTQSAHTIQVQQEHYRKRQQDIDNAGNSWLVALCGALIGP